MNRKTKLIALLLVTVTVAWYFNDPIPEGFSSPWQLRLQHAQMKVSLHLFWIADFYLDICPIVRAYRTLPMAPTCQIPESVTVTDDVLGGVKVRVYRPAAVDVELASQGYPALVYYHGGGWILGSPRTFDTELSAISARADIVVVAVDYRKAPAYKFPAAFDDAVVVAKLVLARGRELGVDPSRVAVGGDSAGGNLAVAVSLRLRDEDFSPRPRLQVLVFPLLQGVDLALPSHVQNANGPLLLIHFTAYCLSMYISGSKNYTSAFVNNDHVSPAARRRLYSDHLRHDDIPTEFRYPPYQKPNLDRGNELVWAELKPILENPYFSPLLAGDFTDLPAAFVYTAHYDLLRDDGLLYVGKLRKAGVRVKHVHDSKGFHGIINFGRHYKEGVDCLNHIIEFLQQKL